MTEQKTLRDVARAISAASDIIEEIERRSLYGEKPARSFEQRVMLAAHEIDKGSPLKDFLSAEDIEIAVKTLADVYVVTGVKFPDDAW
jgi:sialic acid synthase SpsE